MLEDGWRREVVHYRSGCGNPDGCRLCGAVVRGEGEGEGEGDGAGWGLGWVKGG